MIGIGIDTGGTCTDAVIYDIENRKVLASAKSATTHEQLELGIADSLRKLPRELVDQAGYISLSTTLATNACVENKGGRVCLVFIGVSERTVSETYRNYGFESTGFMKFLDADVTRNMEPDWSCFRQMLPEIFSEYDSIAISQLQPKENDGAYEKHARSIIEEEYRIFQSQRRDTEAGETSAALFPVVCAYEIFQDLNAIKRGAGALLNARLIPVITEFFDAVENVLEQEDIRLPFMIMRSDGSLVSREYSEQYPVETLLCGPTASAKGARELFDEDNAVVIDMGGTTSDIALIKDGELKLDHEGVSVGGWQTFVRGIDIDTFALGGDSRVCYRDSILSLENCRVIPISMLAGANAAVREELRDLLNFPKGSLKPLYEHFVLVRDVDEDRLSHYAQEEREMIGRLRNRPMSLRQLAEAVGKDYFNLHTERLERVGVILRSGFTPTDAILIHDNRTDLFGEDGLTAAQMALSFLARSVESEEDAVVGKIFRLVKEKLYCNLVRILWSDSRKNVKTKAEQEYLKNLEVFAHLAFEREMNSEKQRAEETDGTKNPQRAAFFQNIFSTDAKLLGVGAPTYMFLDDVAKALHTEAKISEYSGVTNALGAMLGGVCVYDSVDIRKIYDGDSGDGIEHIVYADKQYRFQSMEEAVQFAGDYAMGRAREKAEQCGAKKITGEELNEQVREGATNYGALIMGAMVTACVRGKLF